MLFPLCRNEGLLFFYAHIPIPPFPQKPKAPQGNNNYVSLK